MKRNSRFLVVGAVTVAVTGLSAAASANPVAGACPAPQGLPAARVSNRLTVESPPRPKPERWLRLRTHRSPADRTGRSTWEGPEVPLFVPLALGAMELTLLDPIPGGYMALYAFKPASLGQNGSYEVRLFSCSGQTLASVPLHPYFSRRTELEVQDVRYADGTLYLNEACQSYSRRAGGRCSALLAVDALSKRLLWRTPPLTSNNLIRVVGNHVITGYGFTSEADYIRVVRRSDGRIVEQEPLANSHFGLEIRGPVLDVEIGGKWSSFSMTGFSTPSPQLTALGTRPAPTVSTPVPSLPLPSALPQWPVPSFPVAPPPGWKWPTVEWR